MSTDTRTPAEIRYDAERNGTLYFPQAPAAVRITPDGTPNKYDTGEYSWDNMMVETPIAALSNGVTVQGTHDVDGSPHCIHYETPDGYFYVGDDGHLAGEWAGINLEIPPAALPKLRALFTSNITTVLQDIARLWAGDERSPKLPEPPMTHLKLMLDLIHLIRERGGDLEQRIAEVLDSRLGIVDFEELPALEAITARRAAEGAQKAA